MKFQKDGEGEKSQQSENGSVVVIKTGSSGCRWFILELCYIAL